MVKIDFQSLLSWGSKFLFVGESSPILDSTSSPKRIRLYWCWLETVLRGHNTTKVLNRILNFFDHLPNPAR